MQIKRISGRPLAVLAAASQHPPAARVIHTMMRRDLRIDELLALPAELRGPVPIHAHPRGARPPRASAEVGPAPSASWATSAVELHERFARGESTPRDEVERIFSQRERLRLDRIDPMIAWTEQRARAEADAASARWKAGAPKGPLDGVPYALKEQINARETRRGVGAKVLDGAPLAETDGTVVERLSAAGAVLVGTSVMTEFGMTPVGANPHRTMPRNPHDGVSLAGGSSTGSGVAVASGLLPLAVGADGGGSIRIPSARVGIFGLKPTWGRVSRDGDASGGSVAHLGPMARTTRDLAAMLQVMSGADERDEDTALAPPPPDFVAATRRGVRGLRIGVCEDEIAEAEPAVQERIRAALVALEAEGALLESVREPLLRWAPPVGYVTIAAESLAALGPLYFEHQAAFSGDLRLSFAALQGFSALEYLDAARIREGLRLAVQRLFQRVDLLALPSTVRSFDRVTDAEFDGGFVDLEMVQGLCRFMFLGNLTGLPAINIPAGRGRSGMPVGLQLVGDAWDEASLLAASATLERAEFARAERPEVRAR